MNPGVEFQIQEEKFGIKTVELKIQVVQSSLEKVELRFRGVENGMESEPKKWKFKMFS